MRCPPLLLDLCSPLYASQDSDKSLFKSNQKLKLKRLINLTFAGGQHGMHFFPPDFSSGKVWDLERAF
jgi:hypothetical protein